MELFFDTQLKPRSIHQKAYTIKSILAKHETGIPGIRRELAFKGEEPVLGGFEDERGDNTL